MKKHIILSGTLLCSAIMFGQVGINTPNPQGIFHVDGAKDNSATGIPTASQQANDFVITTAGSAGIGNTAPKVRIDVRSSVNTDNSIAVGKTTQLASDADAGAIRYTSFNGGKLQYSDGTRWVDLVSFPEKAVVIANNTTGDRVTYNVEKQIIFNNEFVDNFNTYYKDPAIGTNNTALNNAPNGFTAPREGVYLVSATVNLVNVALNAGSSAELRYIVLSTDAGGSPTTATVQRCMKPVTGEAPLVNAQTPVQCLAGVRLKKGDVLQVRLYENVYASGTTSIITRTNSAVTSNDYGFVNLSILEQ